MSDIIPKIETLPDWTAKYPYVHKAKNLATRFMKREIKRNALYAVISGLVAAAVTGWATQLVVASLTVAIVVIVVTFLVEWSIYFVRFYLVAPRKEVERLRNQRETERPPANNAPLALPSASSVDFEQVNEDRGSRQQPKTLQELAKADFNYCLIQSGAMTVGVARPDADPFNIETHIMMDFNAQAEFLTFYIPATPAGLSTKELCLALAREYEKVFEQKTDVRVEVSMPGEQATASKELNFTRRVYIYHETSLLKDDKKEVEREFEKENLALVLRDSSYAFDRNYKQYTFPDVAL